MGYDETFATVSGAMDDHPKNPAFFEHCNRVIARITAVQSNDTQDAFREMFLFMYACVLDLYRKAFYTHRATVKYLEAVKKQDLSDDEIRLLERIANEHNEAFEAERDGGEVAMIEVLERQVHELWAEHQGTWHRRMAELTGIELTTHFDGSGPGPAHEERAALMQALLRRRQEDRDGEDHFEKRLEVGARVKTRLTPDAERRGRKRRGRKRGR